MVSTPNKKEKIANNEDQAVTIGSRAVDIWALIFWNKTSNVNLGKITTSIASYCKKNEKMPPPPQKKQ